MLAGKAECLECVLHLLLLETNTSYSVQESPTTSEADRDGLQEALTFAYPVEAEILPYGWENIVPTVLDFSLGEEYTCVLERILAFLVSNHAFSFDLESICDDRVDHSYGFFYLFFVFREI